MRVPSAPEHPNFEETGPIRVATGARQPSYPDRARIDSDVRYLLRPPSTPWITFDKEQPVFASSRSSVLDASGVFPDAPEAIAAANAVPPVEPSNVVVARDLEPPAEEVVARTGLESEHEITASPVASSRRILAGVASALGLAAAIAIAVFVVGKKHEPAPSSAAAAPTSPSLPVEVAPPNVDPPATPPPPPTAAVQKSGFAKLTIRGAAKSHRVYLDGKLLLGQGQRSFTIRCGDHTIAIGNRSDAQPVDVPCNREYVVAK